MKYIASIFLSLYNSLTINIEITIMQNRRLKLKQVRQEIFKNLPKYFMCSFETLGTGLRNIPMATEFKPEIIWRFVNNSIDVKFRKLIVDKTSNQKQAFHLLAKHYPSGTITDVIEEHMSNNKTSLDESFKMIVDDILNNEC